MLFLWVYIGITVASRSHKLYYYFSSTIAEAEASILQPPDVKNQLIRKDPNGGKDWRQKERRAAEDEMVR